MDIPSLSHTILKKLIKLSIKQITGIHPGVINAFKPYDWPGNIRELEEYDMTDRNNVIYFWDSRLDSPLSTSVLWR